MNPDEAKPSLHGSIGATATAPANGSASMSQQKIEQDAWLKNQARRVVVVPGQVIAQCTDLGEEARQQAHHEADARMRRKEELAARSSARASVRRSSTHTPKQVEEEPPQKQQQQQQQQEQVLSTDKQHSSDKQPATDQWGDHNNKEESKSHVKTGKIPAAAAGAAAVGDSNNDAPQQRAAAAASSLERYAAPPSDEHLVVAIAVDEALGQRDDTKIPSAVEYDPDAKPPLYQNRRFRLYALVGCACVGFAILVGTMLWVKGGGGDSGVQLSHETRPPGDTPTSAPTSHRDYLFRSFLASQVGPLVYEAGTPHDLAVRWILSEDPRQLEPSDTNVLQRFILAFFYFHSTRNGQEAWVSCNPPGIAGRNETRFINDTDINGDRNKCILYDFMGIDEGYQAFPDRVRWMSDAHECDWQGVECQGGEDVLGIGFFGQGLTGTLPTELAALPFLQSITLAYNEMTGSIPATYGGLRHLLNLEIHGNLLTGSIPEEFFNASGTSPLVGFNVGDNLLSGTLSTGIGHLKDLKSLQLFQNNLKGPFPSSEIMGRLNFLTTSRIHGNEFTGPLPVPIQPDGQMRVAPLVEYWYHDNLFTGTISTTLSRLTRLTELRIFGNRLTGTIPTEIFGLTSLTVLELQEMQLNGTLSSLVGQLVNLQDFRVSRNRLTGTIPTELAALSSLERAWLHDNRMNGSMPEAICNLGELQSLQTDCFPEENPNVECLCCTACCDRNKDPAFCLTL